MKRIGEFPFKKARRVTAEEVEEGRKAIEAKFGKKRPSRGRPPKDDDEKYQAISIRLHPEILDWAKEEAKRCGLGYQSIINSALLTLKGKHFRPER